MKYNKTWIIDDDPIPRLILKTKLQRNNICQDVEEFVEPSGCLELLRKGEARIPDLIFLDINMPVLSGWDFLKFVYQENLFGKHKVDVAIVTSSIDQEDRERAKAFDCIQFYLTKPIDIDFMITEKNP